MIVFKHELKQGRTSLIIWTSIISVFLIILLLIYPDMKKDMVEVGNVFDNMGNFSAAFGMDKINFGTVMGYYSIECGNILGIAGGFFAAIIGISSLAKEEKDKTAEFLLTHPISRSKIIFQKYLSILVQILILNFVIVIVSMVSFKVIDEKLDLKEFLFLHLAYTILQLEIASICFGISAFLRKGGIGVGIGLTAILYFMNILKNISENVDFLKYITPYSYAEVSDIISKVELDFKLIGIGAIYSIIMLIIGFIKYTKKDIYI